MEHTGVNPYRILRSLLWALALVAAIVHSNTVLASVDATCPQHQLSVTDEQLTPLKGVCYIADNRHHYNAEQIAEGSVPLQLSNKPALVFSRSDTGYWILVRLRNLSAMTRRWYLQISYPPLDHVEVYVFGGANTHYQRMGDRELFSSRPVDYRYYLQPLDIEGQGSRDIVLHVRSTGSINIPLALYQSGALVHEVENQSLEQGMFYGSLLILVLFNGMLFVTTWRRQYFYNAFYMLSAGLFLASMSGLSYQYLWPLSPWLANKAIPLTQASSVLAFVLFGASFLEINGERPRLQKLIRLMVAVAVISVPLSLMAPYHYMVRWNTAIALLCMLSLYGIGIQRLRQGYAPARWYLISWTLMLFGTALYALAAFGYAADYLANEILMQFALGGQVLLLTYAVVIRVRQLIEQLLQMQTDAKRRLEQLVEERTGELQSTMQALELANQKLQRQNVHDDLTNLYNRRYLDETLEQTFSEARRHQIPLSLILLDADHFKTINDTYGHSFGDECLRTIAHVMTDVVRRPRDTVARYGGEEFVIVLPGTDLAGARHVADTVLERIRQQPLVSPNGKPLKITLSAGVAQLRRDDADVLSWFERADSALYDAKQAGRDRTALVE